ncbi:MAG: ISAzo13 family transposase [Planctomycetes bacterium]|nr:ISAzo13 family transposase [Planctomycetota bacterium]
MDREDAILMKYQLLAPELTERTLRLFAAAEAKVWGRGGISGVSRALELSRARIYRGLQDLEEEEKLEPERIRRKGGGRKSRVDEDPTLKRDLERLVSPYTRGDPESPLRWTCKSIRQLAKELTRKGHQTSHRMVAALLREMGYRLQANRKTIEGKQHPDRDAQFKYINQKTQKQQRAGQPVISVDTKKKEKVGDFKNAGREWYPQGHPEKVRVHDFIDKERGKVAPYGVYDLTKNNGWVSVGIDHDTAALAVRKVQGLEHRQFDEDENLRLALTHLIQTFGEAARHVSGSFQQSHPNTPGRRSSECATRSFMTTCT